MTEAEYLSPINFPRTTQPGLSLQQQMMLDAANLDDASDGGPLNAEEQAIVRELTVKKSAWSSLSANTQNPSG